MDVDALEELIVGARVDAGDAAGRLADLEDEVSDLLEHLEGDPEAIRDWVTANALRLDQINLFLRMAQKKLEILFKATKD